jgi:hypothetical protein
MLLKCYHHLHPLFENAIVDPGVDTINWTFLKLTTSTTELAKEFVNKELLIFKRFQMDAKCPFQ